VRAIRAVDQRQDRERAGRIEDLIGDVAMRLFVRDRGDHRDMLIGPARDRDPGRIAGRRLAALGADQQGSVHCAPVGERYRHAVEIAPDVDRFRRPHQGQPHGRARRLVERAAQVPILEHMAERAVIGGGFEQQRLGTEPVLDPDRGDRAAPAFEPLAHADRLEHAPGRAGDRRSAAVEGRRQSLVRIGGIDHHRPDTVLLQRDTKGEADKTSAEDDDVKAVHG
jgi:hypothetical protein